MRRAVAGAFRHELEQLEVSSQPLPDIALGVEGGAEVRARDRLPADDELELLEFTPEGAVGTPDQDLLVLRRTESPQARPDANS